MRAFVAALVVLSLIALCSAQEANIILRKRIHTDYQGVLAIDHNFTVELTVFNVGKRYV